MPVLIADGNMIKPRGAAIVQFGGFGSEAVSYMHRFGKIDRRIESYR